MGVIYLDIDDEITSAANRIRSAREPRIALVLPAGTRLATSRINFRLLAREAIAYRRELAIVAPEPAARALAAAAGLPVFSSVVEYEVAVAALGGATADDGEPRGGAAETGPDGGPANGGIDAAGGAALAGGAGLGGPAAQTGTPEATRIMQSGATGGAAAGTRRAPSVRDTGGLRSIRSGGTFEQVRARSGIPTETIVLPPDDRSASQRGHRGLLVGLVALVGLVLVAGGVGAWLLLPDAVITIRARPEPIGPVQFTVRADPLAASMDQQAGVVPAQLATFDLSAQGTFPSTGRKVTETKAAGSLRWTNCDPTRSYTIAAGTVARTNASVGFSTASDVFLPVAILSGNPPQITCQSRDVRITATDSGLAGN
ncbi:MAG TPA: hypothetical protein VNF73_07175, partial [Candidatus Saccharimonadales bacterium]|nr:hypothetical protein [Candidatus Saccharimonadales bacterium]